ncbi:hypothetical protein SESBI_11100 [Sesbania bispinosa]|nr:hypothetical protein SESBI_11100 [Sesbania bispinosa]
MFCLAKPIVANATIPPNPDSSSSSQQQINTPNPNRKPPSLGATKPFPRNRLPRRPPQPSVIQIERVVGAGSFRDGEPQPRDSDIRKSVFDLFLGQAFEGPVEKKLRQTGEWLVGTAETRFRSSGVTNIHNLQRIAMDENLDSKKS